MTPWENGLIMERLNANNPLEQTKQMGSQRQDSLEINRTLVIQANLSNVGIFYIPVSLCPLPETPREVSSFWSRNFIDNISS